MGTKVGSVHVSQTPPRSVTLTCSPEILSTGQGVIYLFVCLLYKAMTWKEMCCLFVVYRSVLERGVLYRSVTLERDVLCRSVTYSNKPQDNQLCFPQISTTSMRFMSYFVAMV